MNIASLFDIGDRVFYKDGGMSDQGTVVDVIANVNPNSKSLFSYEVTWDDGQEDEHPEDAIGEVTDSTAKAWD